MKSAACVLAIAAMILAGCSGGDGSSALASASGPDAAARSWASDAALVFVSGFETDTPPPIPDVSSKDCEEAEAQGFDCEEVLAYSRALSVPDITLGDGNLPAWGFIYMSPSRERVIGYAVQHGSVVAKVEASLSSLDDFEAAAAGALQDARQAWRVESSEAMAAVRAASPAVDAFLGDATNLTILYNLDLLDGEWTFNAFSANHGMVFAADVDFATAEVTDIRVDPDLDDLTPDGTPRPPPPRLLPDDIDETQTVLVGATAATSCGPPVVGTCYEYTFTAENEVNYDASLTWGTDVNDFDLYLYTASGQAIDFSAVSAPGNSESMTGTLEKGNYRVVVETYLAVQETFHLTVTFS